MKQYYKKASLANGSPLVTYLQEIARPPLAMVATSFSTTVLMIAALPDTNEAED